MKCVNSKLCVSRDVYCSNVLKIAETEPQNASGVRCFSCSFFLNKIRSSSNSTLHTQKLLLKSSLVIPGVTPFTAGQIGAGAGTELGCAWEQNLSPCVRARRTGAVWPLGVLPFRSSRLSAQESTSVLPGHGAEAQSCRGQQSPWR